MKSILPSRPHLHTFFHVNFLFGLNFILLKPRNEVEAEQNRADNPVKNVEDNWSNPDQNIPVIITG
jgi:hypothetical protein